MIYVGIDYSLSCPAMCLMTQPDIANCIFYYLTSIKKDSGHFFNGSINGFFHSEYSSEQQRYAQIADFFVSKIPSDSPIFIEDYSFGSKGKVFHIAENCGILKHKLYEAGHTYNVVAPTVIKKEATGKGNADKQKMYEAFIKETGIDLVKDLFSNKKLGSPVTDIIDSYYISKHCFNSYKESYNP